MISKPSLSLLVISCKEASCVISSQASTKSPLIRPAIVALARPGPISRATSITETLLSNERVEPSGRVITGMFFLISGGSIQSVA